MPKFLRPRVGANSYISLDPATPTQHKPTADGVIVEFKMRIEFGKPLIVIGRDSQFQHAVYVSGSSNTINMRWAVSDTATFAIPAALDGEVATITLQVLPPNEGGATSCVVVGETQTYDLGSVSLNSSVKTGTDYNLFNSGTVYSEADFYYAKVTYIRQDRTSIDDQWEFDADTLTIGDTTITDSINGYVASLVNWDLSQDLFTESAPNTSPVVDAGNDVTVVTGAQYTLSASNTVDADGDTLSYAWSITSAPAGSSATLDTPNLVDTTFTPDVDGAYVFQVSVDDGVNAPVTDSITMTAQALASTLNMSIATVEDGDWPTLMCNKADGTFEIVTLEWLGGEASSVRSTAVGTNFLYLPYDEVSEDAALVVNGVTV